MRAGIIVESGEPREVHHLALLIGYGAGAVNPYLAFETIAALCRDEPARRAISRRPRRARTYVKGAEEGPPQDHVEDGDQHPVSSYQGAQIFEAIGIDQVVIDRYFTGTASRIRGVGLRRDRRRGDSRVTSERTAARARDTSRRRRALPLPRHTASATCGTRAPSRSCSSAVRLEDAAELRGVRASSSTSRPREPITLRGLWELEPAGRPVPARRGRARTRAS